MSTRTTLRPYTVIAAQPMVSSITSVPTILQSLSMLSYSVSWSGTSPVGTLSVQVSNDYSVGPDGHTVVNAGTWTSLVMSVGGSPSSSIAVSGNSGTAFIDITQTCAYAARLVYTAGSGTGSLTAVVVGKVQ